MLVSIGGRIPDELKARLDAFVEANHMTLRDALELAIRVLVDDARPAPPPRDERLERLEERVKEMEEFFDMLTGPEPGGVVHPFPVARRIEP